MTSQTPLTWRPLATLHPADTAARRSAARALRWASAALERLASRVAAPATRPLDSHTPLEFHADAGAPEGGVLYLDGRLVGWVEGVNRL